MHQTFGGCWEIIDRAGGIKVVGTMYTHNPMAYTTATYLNKYYKYIMLLKNIILKYVFINVLLNDNLFLMCQNVFFTNWHQ